MSSGGCFHNKMIFNYFYTRQEKATALKQLFFGNTIWRDDTRKPNRLYIYIVGGYYHTVHKMQKTCSEEQVTCKINAKGQIMP